MERAQGKCELRADRAMLHDYDYNCGSKGALLTKRYTVDQWAWLSGGVKGITPTTVSGWHYFDSNETLPKFCTINYKTKCRYS